MKRALAVAGVILLVGASTAACDWSDKVTEPFKDAPRSKVTNEAPADVVTMPDGFSNLSTKCGPGGMRYTVAYHGDSPYASISVVVDPTCSR